MPRGRRHRGGHRNQPQASSQRQNVTPTGGANPGAVATALSGRVQTGTDARPTVPRTRKDQRRAIWAYQRAQAAVNDLSEYEGAVQTFAATVLRNELGVAASVLERDRERAGPRQLIADLAAAPDVPGLSAAGAVNPNKWPGRVRGLASLDDYMLATRELLALATWLRRACRALSAMSQASPSNA